MNWNEFKSKVELNRKIKEEGGYNCIELPFNRTKNYIPGIIRGENVIVTASSGVGKTQFTKYLYVYHAFLWSRDKDINLHVKYFALEETKEEFIAGTTCFFLKHYYNIDIDKNLLLSMNEKVPLYIKEKLNLLDDIIKEFLEVVDIQDDISNPTGILKNVEGYALQNGTVYKKNVKFSDKPVFDKYVPNDPNEYVIIITDHISLLQEERNLNKHQTISLFSADYGRKIITKKFNYIFVMVQQQSAESEKKQYNNKGDLNLSKLEPSLSELADNKYTQRDAHLIWGIFAPDRYEIPNYSGYNIFKFQDNFRSAKVLKNRNGRSNIAVPLFFKGNCIHFNELPKVKKDFQDILIQDIPEDLWYKKYNQDKEFWLQKNKLFKS